MQMAVLNVGYGCKRSISTLLLRPSARRFWLYLYFRQPAGWRRHPAFQLPLLPIQQKAFCLAVRNCQHQRDCPKNGNGESHNILCLLPKQKFFTLGQRSTTAEIHIFTRLAEGLDAGEHQNNSRMEREKLIPCSTAMLCPSATTLRPSVFLAYSPLNEYNVTRSLLSGTQEFKPTFLIIFDFSICPKLIFNSDLQAWIMISPLL